MLVLYTVCHKTIHLIKYKTNVVSTKMNITIKKYFKKIYLDPIKIDLRLTYYNS